MAHDEEPAGFAHTDRPFTAADQRALTAVDQKMERKRRKNLARDLQGFGGFVSAVGMIGLYLVGRTEGNAYLILAAALAMVIGGCLAGYGLHIARKPALEAARRRRRQRRRKPIPAPRKRTEPAPPGLRLQRPGEER